MTRQTLFAPIEHCQQAKVWLYGQIVTVYDQGFAFHWESPETTVRCGLTQLANGRQFMWVSTDGALSGPEVIAAYGFRVKSELTFGTLIHLIGGLAYRFWLKAMTTAPSWPKNLNLADYPESVQGRILANVDAMERLVNLNAMALGILQGLALALPTWFWSNFPRWFRTLPQHGYPRERIVQLVLQHQAQEIFLRSPASLLLPQFLAAKLIPQKSPDTLPLTA